MAFSWMFARTILVAWLNCSTYCEVVGLLGSAICFPVQSALFAQIVFDAGSFQTLFKLLFCEGSQLGKDATASKSPSITNKKATSTV